MNQHTDLTVNVTKYSGYSMYDTQRYIDALYEALDTGTVDIFMVPHDAFLFDPAVSSRLEDLYTIMRSDPKFNEDDYMMNVIDAFSYKGGLYEFPLVYTWEYMTVNRLISTELTRAFATYQTISVNDLFELRNNINTGFRTLYSGFDVYEAVRREMGTFIDYQQWTCDFNNQRFIDLLNNSIGVTGPEIDNLTYSELHITFDEKNRLSTFPFNVAYHQHFHYILQPEQGPDFVLSTPFTDSKGRIVLGGGDPYGPYRFSIAKNAENRDVAWEFLKYMTTAHTYGLAERSIDGSPGIDILYRNASVSIPTAKIYFDVRTHMVNPMPTQAYSRNGWQFRGTRDEQAEYMENWYVSVSETPAVYNPDIGQWDILRRVLPRFVSKELSAAEAAEEIQSLMYTLMNERRN
jgi:ABC-type glycerol-3-phosphate transport system substrate-binding protein